MSTSKGWSFSNRGLPWHVLSLEERLTPALPPEFPLPRSVPLEQEWLQIRVALAGLNPGAIFQMTLIPPFLRKRTCVPDMDLSGAVTNVWMPEDSQGARARFKVGDRVLAMLPAHFTVPTGVGALAEYVVILAQYAVLKPSNVRLADGAGVLLPGLTARQMVSEAEIKEGDRVLVNAASGGIGTLAVQMIRNAIGASGYIVGICSGKNASLVKSLGADEAIDYTLHASLPSHLSKRFSAQPFNAVVDTRGHQSLYLHSPSYLVKGGNYVSVGVKPPTFFVPDFLRAVWQMKLNEYWPLSPWLGGVGRRWVGTSMMNPTLEDRQAVVDMLAQGKVRVVIDSVYPFSQAREAYRKLADGHVSGKILVEVDPSIADDER